MEAGRPVTGREDDGLDQRDSSGSGREREDTGFTDGSNTECERESRDLGDPSIPIYKKNTNYLDNQEKS